MTSTESSAAPVLRYRWLILAMVFLATVLNYVDRQTLSVVAPQLKERFGITDEGYGTIVSFFMLAYTVMNGVSGVVIDRLGAKLGYVAIMAWWSIAGMLHAFARTGFGFGVCRFLLGVGEAGNWPAGVKVVSEWFPAKDRALAGGIFNSGSSIGALLAAPLVAWLVLRFGFREAFVFTGAVGLIWIAVWLLIYRRPPGVVNDRPREKIPVWRLLRTRFVCAFALSNVFMDSCWFFYVFWIPKYLSQAFHFTLADIGKTAWIPFVSADLGNIAGGFVTRGLIARGIPVPRARKICCTIFACLMPGAILAPFSSSPAVAIAWISLATFGYCGFVSNGLAFPADVFPQTLTASVYGLASMGSGIGGTIFGWLTGWAVEHHGYTPVFAVYSILPLLGLAVILFLLGPLVPDPRFASSAATKG